MKFMDYFRLGLALLPFLVFCLLLIFHRSASLLKISLVALIITIVITVLFWQGGVFLISFSLVKGLLLAFDILLIIFGAILFLEILKKTKVTASLAFHLDNLSPDFRVQVIMLAWFLENFLEGIAGFGTPSTVVAPLLVALGLSPFKAAIIALLGNSTSVPFGAVGTPIRVGFSGVDIDLVSVGSSAALYNFIGLLVPVFILWALLQAAPNRFTLFRQALPFALWSGLAFVLPSYLVSLFGIEFPSILGAIVGVVLVVMTNRFGLFVPRPTYRNSNIITKTTKFLNLKQMLFPYGLFIILLVLAKFLLAKSVITLPALSYSINLFNPGWVFLLTSLLVVVYSKVNRQDFWSIFRLAGKKSIEPFLVIATMSAIVQLMNNSGDNLRQLPSITKTIAGLFNTPLLPVIAPFVGALGSFITGSATVSNLMFAPSLYSSSLLAGFDPIKILALALVGAGAGNMIALADVLVAITVVGVKAQLRKILFSLLPFCLIFLTLVALAGLLI